MSTIQLQREDKSAVLRRLIHLGYQYHPSFPDARNVSEADVNSLELDDPEARALIAGYQTFLSDDFDAYSYAEHGRRGIPDGEIGPATYEMIMAPRCEVPDFFPPDHEVYRQGTGNWKGCWGVGDFHACRDKVDDRNMPAHVRRNWDKIVATVVDSYAEVGLLWLPSKDWTEYNTDMYWVRSSSGWIGLASVMNGRGCGKSGMNSYLASYAANQSDAWIVQHWSVLVLHEKMHNCGFGHSNGGIGNPSLRPGTKPTWKGDVLESAMRQKFGGVRVPIPGSPTDPKPPTDPPADPPTPGGTFQVIEGDFKIKAPNGLPPGEYGLRVAPRMTF